MKEAHVEFGTGFRPTVETDVKPQVHAELHSLDDGWSTQTNDSLKPQSGPEGQMVMAGENETTAQNILFRDQNPSYDVEIEHTDDPTRQLRDTDDTTLQNFFSRPLKISEETWDATGPLGYDIDPWSLYFNNPRVINRIANFNLLRANLHLKIVINGNGFLYGRCLAAYLPFEVFDEASTLAAPINADLVQTSQLPKLFIDPTNSTGGTMSLPFFYHKDSVLIPRSEWSDLGKLFVREINPLKHANGGTRLATISIFAWATDVEMSVPTSNNPVTLSPQSGKEKGGKSKSKKKAMQKTSNGGRSNGNTKQESSGKEVDEANSNGIVSGPATVISKVAGALSFIPQIAPFAMATSKVAGTVANVARALGYSRPTVTKNPDPLRPTPTSQLATTNTPDTAIKMTVDDKQELSIDPGIAGIGCEDPLSIKAIASRESYLTKFDWSTDSNPEELLWNCRVDPVLWATSGFGTGQAYHLPACAMAALPFQYWTGTMKFRFQIVCSSFHKGRIKIVYDPRTLVGSEYNVNYIEIMDIAENQDFTIEVGNAQEFTLLNHHTPAVDTVSAIYGTIPFGTTGPGNGVLGVYVVNQLTTPSDDTVNNDIEVNVFVSMGDDFEVFVPQDTIKNYVFKPQSGIEPQSGTEQVPESTNTEEPSAPQHQDTEMMAMGMQDTQLINKVYTGEAICSFRPLLKRYNLWRREFLGNSSTSRWQKWSKRFNMFPFFRGNVPQAVDTRVDGEGTAPYNYVNTTLLHWIASAHQGWRGSIRYKLLVDVSNAANTTNNATSLYVERDRIQNFGTPDYQNSWSEISDFETNSSAAASAVAGNSDVTGQEGMVYMTSHINNNAEFEVPYYSRFRFTPGKRLNYTGNAEDTLTPGFRMEMRNYNTGKTVMDYHVAVGEDFQVYFFTGLPRIYYELNPPTPV